MQTPFKKSLLYSAIIAGLGMAGLVAMPVMAQENDEDEQEQETEETADLERILVTGSRIERAGVDTFYPAISVDAQLLDDAAFTNVADALNQIPSFGPGIDPSGDQGGFTTGQNFVNFLGLGTQRTLTLMDGRRFVSSNTPLLFGTSGGLQVDFNVIPIAIVDRVETIGVGGAPIYGSDAIAGTINVITKDDYEGFEALYRYGMTEESDNKFHNTMMIAGGNFDNNRGNVYASVEYTWQDPLEGTARPNVRDQSAFLTDDDGIRRIFRNRRIGIFTHGGLISDPASGLGYIADPPGGLGLGPLGIFPDGNFYQFDGNSNLMPFTPGEPDPSSVFFALGGDGPTFFDEVEQINSELDRGVFSSGATYEFDNGVRFSSDFLYAKTQSTELSNQGGFQTWAFGVPGEESGPILFSADNPFLPQQARDVLAANEIDTFALHRFNNDIIDSSVNMNQNLWRLTAGLDGEFFAGDKRFHWDTHFVYGDSDMTFRREGIINERFFNAVDVRQLTEEDLQEVSEEQIMTFSGTSSAGVGDIVCESAYQAALDGGLTDTQTPFVLGCVPLNLFGEGVRSPAAREWVTGNLINEVDMGQYVGTASFGGDLFELPGGAFAFALGYERRKERGDFIPDTASEMGLSRSAPFPPTGGEYTTDEFFGEISAPLVSPDMNVPFVNLLELNGAFRTIDNTIVDGSDDTWTLGGRWAPVNGFTFRGNYTESVRAPAIVELFTPQTQSFSFADDPCDNRFVDAGPVPDTRRANCEQELGFDPSDFTSNIVNATAEGETAGNPNLDTEEAEAWALGFSWEPEFLENFLLTADWIDVSLEDAIVNLGLTDLMVACFDSTDYPDAAACERFTRDEDGQVIDFLTGWINAATFKTSRLEIGANYRWTWDGVGEFSHRAQTSYADSRKVSVTGEDASETVGGWTFPKWAGTFDTIYTRDRHRLFWRIQWQEKAKLSVSGDFEYERDDGKPITRTRWRHLHNISYSYELPRFGDWAPQRTMVQFNIDNLFDRQPDATERAAGHYGFSELLGRRYTVSLRGTF